MLVYDSYRRGRNLSVICTSVNCHTYYNKCQWSQLQEIFIIFLETL